MQLFLFASATLALWRPSVAAASKSKNRHVITDVRPVIWESDTQTDVRLELLSASNLSLELRCNFKTVTSWSRKFAREFEFCFDYGDPFLHICGLVKLSKRRDVLKIGSVSVALEYSPMSVSATATIAKVPPEQELPLFYVTCREKTNVGVITSNRLFVLDLRRNFPKTIWRRSEPLQLNKNGPSTVECLQKSLGVAEKLYRSRVPWRQPLVPVTFEWFFCTKRNMSECEKEKRPLFQLAAFSDWPVQVRENGQLYSPFIPEKIATKLEKKRLLCYVMNKLTTFYESPLRIQNSVTVKRVAFKMGRPQGVETITLLGSDYSVKLPCLFDVAPGQHFELRRMSTFWTYFSKYGDFMYPRNTSDIDIRSVLKLSKRRDMYFRNLNDLYFNCSITSGNITLSGAYRVTIITPPRLKSTVPRVMKAIHGQTASVKCFFEDQRNITLGLAICGQSVDWNNSEALSATQRQLNTRYNAVLPPLTFYVNVTAPNDNKVIEYTETNITYSWKYIHASRVVTCIANRGMFSNRGWIRFDVEPERPRYALDCDVPSVCDKACDLRCELVNLTALLFPEEAESKITWYLQDNVSDSSWGTIMGKEFQFNYFYPEFKTTTRRVTASAQIFHSIYRSYAVFNASKSWNVRFQPWITGKQRNTIFQCLIAVVFVSAAIGGVACFLLSRRHGFQNEELVDRESRKRLTEA